MLTKIIALLKSVVAPNIDPLEDNFQVYTLDKEIHIRPSVERQDPYELLMRFHRFKDTGSGKNFITFHLSSTMNLITGYYCDMVIGTSTLKSLLKFGGSGIVSFCSSSAGDTLVLTIFKNTPSGPGLTFNWSSDDCLLYNGQGAVGIQSDFLLKDDTYHTSVASSNKIITSTGYFVIRHYEAENQPPNCSFYMDEDVLKFKDADGISHTVQLS